MTTYITAAVAVLGAGLMARLPHINYELNYGPGQGRTSTWIIYIVIMIACMAITYRLQADSAPTTSATITTTDCLYRATTIALLETTFSLHASEPPLVTVTYSPTTVVTDLVQEPQSQTIILSGLEASSNQDHDESTITTQTEHHRYHGIYDLPRSLDYPDASNNANPLWRTSASSGTTTSDSPAASDTEQREIEEPGNEEEQQRLEAQRREYRLRELHERARVPPDTEQFVTLWEDEIIPRTRTIMNAYSGGYSLTSGRGVNPRERAIELVSDSELSEDIKIQLRDMLNSALPANMRSRTSIAFYVERTWPRERGAGVSSSGTRTCEHESNIHAGSTTVRTLPT